ncbi:MAG: hypothetical protein IKI83_05760 [Prevotella sp.]|nr:hypothetical protein [Prevotella sp.]
MNRISRTTFIAAFISIFVLVTSCKDNHTKEFNRLLLELADNDQTIDRDDWIEIEKYLDSQKANFRFLFDDDNISIQGVKEYIQDFFERRRPSKEIQFVGIGGKEYMNVNFYLERSGSMTPYDSPNGDGSFKAAIVQMLNNLPGNNEDNKIYVVNSSINAYPDGFSKFISDTNIFEATKGIGDPSYTDFGAIFTQLLDKTGEDELSILVSDMIYSTKDMIGINPQKVFAEAQGMANAVFKKQVQDKAMLIVKMNGSFSGPYYCYNSPKGGKSYTGRRPYYIVVVGSNQNIVRLTKDKNYLPFSNFSELKGYENMYLFETDDVYKPYYSFMLSNPDIRGRFAPEHGKDTQIKDLTDMEVDRNSGDIRLALAVDLSGMLIDKDYLTDVKNYQIDSDDKLEIKEIREINKNDITPAEKKYIGSATHIFILGMNEIKNDQHVEIKLLNNLPSWIEETSSDDDTNVGIGNFSQTTFGLKYLMQGIYNSYKKNSKQNPYYFELEMNFKK